MGIVAQIRRRVISREHQIPAGDGRAALCPGPCKVRAADATTAASSLADHLPDVVQQGVDVELPVEVAVVAEEALLLPRVLQQPRAGGEDKNRDPSGGGRHGLPLQQLPIGRVPTNVCGSGNAATRLKKRDAGHIGAGVSLNIQI
jgi:hypothetical protein